MSDNQDLNTEDFVEEEQLDEFKASMGDPSEVPAPTATKVKKRMGDKDAGEKTPPKQGSSDSEKAAEVPMPKTKMGMINAMVNQMNGMSKKDMMNNYNVMMSAMMGKKPVASMEGVETDEDKISLSSKDEIKISTADIDIKDDMQSLFNIDSDLSEEFKEKASTIFEAAVVSKINEQLEKITIDVEGEINEAKEQIKTDLEEKLDSYMDYVVENWMAENELAVDKGLRAEIAQDFMEGLKNLFTDHYIDVPDEKVDVAEELATKSEELETALNEQIEKNSAMKKELEEFKKQDLFAEESKDLSDTQAEKFAKLAEGIEFTTEESFKKKLQMVKENYFSGSVKEDVKEVVSDDEEPLELEEAAVTQVDPAMAAYMNAISRTGSKGSKKINNQ